MAVVRAVLRHTQAMQRRSRIAPVVALLVAVAAVGCSSGGGDTTQFDDSGVPSVSDTVDGSGDVGADGAAVADIEAALDEEPVFAEPVFDPAISATALIEAAAGGAVELELRNGGSAVLTVPAGALAADTTISIVEVGSLGLGEGAFTGVEVLPAGLVFTPENAPTLTLQPGDGQVADFAVAWDADDTLERSVAVDNADGSVTVPLLHFSGAGIGVGDSPLTASEVDQVLADVRDRIEEAAASGDSERLAEAVETSAAELESLSKGYQREALGAAAQRCHEYGPVIDELRIAALAALLGVEVSGNDDLVGQVLVGSADCALDECAAADPTAAGRFVRATSLVQAGLGDVDSAVAAALGSAITDGRLLDCATFEVSIRARTDLQMGTPITEGLVARGAVLQGEAGGQLRLQVSAKGWEQLTADMLNGMGGVFGQYLGVPFPEDFVNCEPPAYGPGVMATSVTTAPGVDPGTLLPVLRFRPYMPTSLLVCNGQTDPNLPAGDPLVLTVLAFMPGVQFDGTAAQHYFIEVEETGLLSWTANSTFDTGVAGIPGSASLTMQVRVASRPPGPTGAPPAAMRDIFALYAS